MPTHPVKQLDISDVQRWVTAGSRKLSQPAAIGIACPQCTMRGVFTTKRRTYDEQRDTLCCSANCPACNLLVNFWVLDLIGQHDDQGESKARLYMDPSTSKRMSLADIPEAVPENFVQFFSSTQDVYASGNFVATNVLAQATLETLFAGFMPVGNSRTSLSKLIQDSIQSLDLDTPLVNLSTSLRQDGHLGQLLTNSQNINQDTADATLLLLEHLITFLFVMPEEFRKLDELFAELHRAAEAEQKLNGDDQDNTRNPPPQAGSRRAA